MTAANHSAGGEFSVASNGLVNRFTLLSVAQTSVDAFPECLCKRDVLREWKRHRFGGELLSRQAENVATQKASFNTGRERKPNISNPAAPRPQGTVRQRLIPR